MTDIFKNPLIPIVANHRPKHTVLENQLVPSALYVKGNVSDVRHLHICGAWYSTIVESTMAPKLISRLHLRQREWIEVPFRVGDDPNIIRIEIGEKSLLVGRKHFFAFLGKNPLRGTKSKLPVLAPQMYPKALKFLYQLIYAHIVPIVIEPPSPNSSATISARSAIVGESKNRLRETLMPYLFETA